MEISNDKINDFLDKPVRHPIFNKCIEYIHSAYKSTGSYPISIYILANSGVGKSVLATTCLNLINASVKNTVERRQFPAIKITLRAGALPREVQKEILNEIGVPSKNYGYDDLRVLFEKQLKVCMVRMIFIDEFHNLLRDNDKGINIKAAQFIKQLIENHNISVVLLGTHRGSKLFELSEELRSRFTPAPELKLMSCSTIDSKRYFQKYLEKYFNNAPIKFPDFNSENNIYRIQLATNGNLRRLRYMIQYVMINHTGNGTVSVGELEKAYDFTKEMAIKNRNGVEIKPFESALNLITAALGIG